MRLFGLDAGSLTIALLAVVALLAWLYLRKRPTRRVLVPSLISWRGVEGAGSRRFAANLSSLLLALLIACLLLGALADPRPSYEAGDFVLLIERGVAMSARDVPGTRLAEAKRAAHARVEALRPGDRAQVMSFAAHVTTHSELTSDRGILHQAIDQVELSDARSDPTLPIAGKLLYFGSTDLAADERVVIGTSDRNVGVRAFGVRSSPLDRAHVSGLITVGNFGSQEERVTLRVGSSHEETFALPAHSAATRTLDELPARALEASITLAAGPDPLPADDRAVAAAEARPARVLLVSPGNRYLEAALLVDPQLQLTRAQTFAPGDYDVVIFDRTPPMGELPWLYLGGGDRYAQRPYFDRLQATPLLAGLALRDVNIARASVTPLREGERALASSADGTPLLIEGPRHLQLTFALAESDFGLRAAFPVFVRRAVDHLRGAPPAEETHVAGESFLAHGEVLRAPDGAETPVTNARIAIEHAGRYELLSNGQAQPLAILAHAGPIAPQGRPTSRPPGASWYWPLLAAAALVLLAYEARR